MMDEMDDEEGEPPLLHAFMGCGIELEYMIVDRDRLSVLPIADRLLRTAAGVDAGDAGEVSEVRRGLLGWSNELVAHLIEVKNLRPSASLSQLPQAFQAEIGQINRLLQQMNARLMPGAMHPWMDPRSETRLWPHDPDGIYRSYARIFDVRSHGWANLQSMHINLPFADDEEFARLHAAIRLVLPILPALAASSPIAEGRATGFADYRMQTYSGNAQAIPSIAGLVIPDTVSSRAAYEHDVLASMYRDIAPHDPDRILRREWLNSRGAIARFDRNAIEIRVVDTQECPYADLAIAAAAMETVRWLYRQSDHDSKYGLRDLQRQQQMPTASLAALLRACIRDADQSMIEDEDYLQLFGFPGARCSANDLWWHLIGRMMDEDASHARQWESAWRVMLEQGPLARRILRAVGGDFSPGRLQEVYRQLCDCLQEGRLFVPNPANTH
jgi:gamma-glutamyl:cysteine ligase YbdK (ATP-grasp superfamily)